jgi:hypothetical protein
VTTPGELVPVTLLPYRPVSLSAGRPLAAPPDSTLNRVLDSTEIRSHLARVDRFADDVCVVFIDDLSGSMLGGNDVTGTRHEAMLIAAEHVAALNSQRVSVKIITFDGGTSLDIKVDRLDHLGRSRLSSALLGDLPGSSSNISRAGAEAIRTAPSGRWCLVVCTDFQLFDSNPDREISALLNSSADEVVMLSFGSPPPTVLATSRARTLQLGPENSPVDVAGAIVDAVIAAAGTKSSATGSSSGSRPRLLASESLFGRLVKRVRR